VTSSPVGSTQPPDRYRTHLRRVSTSTRPLHVYAAADLPSPDHHIRSSTDIRRHPRDVITCRVNSATRPPPHSSAPGLYIDSAAVRLRRRRSAVARPTSGRRRTSAAISVTSSPVGSTPSPDHCVAVVSGYTYSPAVVRLCRCRYFSYRQLPAVTALIQLAQINSACRPSWVNGQRLSVLYRVSTACQLCRLEVRQGVDHHRRPASVRRLGPVPIQAVVQYNRKSCRSTMV